MFGEHFEEAEIIRPFLNTVPMFDIISGHPIQLPDGTTVINGGLSPITGVAGMPNAFKSAVAHFFNLSTMNNYYPYVKSMAYDTEESMSYNRMRMLATRMYPLNQHDMRTEGLLYITDSAKHLGGDWWDRLKTWAKESVIREQKKRMVTLPWIDPATKTYAKTIMHTNVEMDSISMFQAEVTEKMYEDNIVGDSGLNTEAMRGQAAKTQMLMQMPTYTQRARMNIIMTAHMGKVIPMDPRLPPEKKLAFMKANYSFKHVGEKFYFLTNNLWLCLNVRPLLNQKTKLPEFPRNPQDDIKRDVDLVTITIQNARAKSGPTGGEFNIVASQRDGLLMDLSNMNYIKNRKDRRGKKWGIGGNDQKYFCELWPETVVQRTTVRRKLDEDPLFRRATELALELCLMKDFWNREDFPEMIEPAELYEIIKGKGLDWEVLLNTQSQYTYKEVRDARPDIPPTMTAIDLLNVAHGKLELPWYKAHAAKIAKQKASKPKESTPKESSKEEIAMPA